MQPFYKHCRGGNILDDDAKRKFSRDTYRDIRRHIANMKPQNRLNIVYQFAKSIEMLHNMSIIHHDVKPGNNND